MKDFVGIRSQKPIGPANQEAALSLLRESESHIDESAGPQ